MYCPLQGSAKKRYVSKKVLTLTKRRLEDNSITFCTGSLKSNWSCSFLCVPLGLHPQSFTEAGLISTATFRALGNERWDSPWLWCRYPVAGPWKVHIPYTYIHIDELCMYIWREGETNYIYSTSMICTDYMTEHYKQFCNIAKRGVGIKQLLQLLRLNHLLRTFQCIPKNLLAKLCCFWRSFSSASRWRSGAMNICVAVSMKWQTPCYSKDDKLQLQLGIDQN